MKRFLSFIGVLALIALGVGIGIIAPFFFPKPLVLEQDANVSDIDPETISIEHRTDAGSYINIQSTQLEPDTLLIFYPGGLVRPQAYTWLGVALAPLGVQTVIPEFFTDLAVTAPNRAEALIALYGENDALDAGQTEGFQPLSKRVVLAGHSLGGAMAARYALRNPNNADALILMASFSADSDDLSALPIAVLSQAAEFDGLAELTEVQASLARLPDDTQLDVIEGAVHSFFGRYGSQRSDGTPTVTRAQAEADIVASLESFLSQLE